MKASKYEISAELREDFGKRDSRRLRAQGMTPGVVYGDKQNIPIVVNENDLQQRIKDEGFFSHIVTLKLNKKNQKVILKDLQRHPYKDHILHLDFQTVSTNEEITVHVPIHFINEDTCIGVKQENGAINHVMSELEITCLPDALPEFIEIDVGALHVGETIHLGDVTLPEDVALYAIRHGGDPKQPVVSIYLPRSEVIEDEAPVAPETKVTAQKEEEDKSGEE